VQHVKLIESTYEQQKQLSTQVVCDCPQHILGSLANLLSPMVWEPCDSHSVTVLRRVTLATPVRQPQMCTPVQPYELYEIRTRAI
jgi:hypothetical protein